MADCEGQRITICVTGTKGSGKSTLIKSLLEGQARIISTGDVIATALATASVKYEGEFLGVPASFYYITAPSNFIFKKLLVENVEALDLFDTSALVLFCVKMYNRSCNDEIEEEIEVSVRWLSKYLGQQKILQILRKTIFVLTFADAEGFSLLPGSSRSVARNVAILMTKCMTKWSLCFKDCLKKQDIPDEIINKMPVCAAGKGSEVKLPLTNDWVKTLWECCMAIAQRETETDVSQQTIGHFVNCDAKKSLEKGMQEGYVSLNYIKMVICGPPCVGKTAFKNLLANRPPPLKHDSTSIAARPIEGIERIASGDEVWKEVTEEDLLEMLSDTIRYYSIHHQLSETLEIDGSIAHEAEYSSTKQDVPPLSQSNLSLTPSSLSQETVDCPTADIDFASKKIIEQLSFSTKNTASPIKLHEESTWIHLLDSGGQPQFTDLLRMFVRGKSLYIIVMKVTESLHDKPTFVYSINGKALNTPKEMTMTNLQIIERFVRSVAATSRGQIRDNSEPAFAIIATHCDQSIFKRFLGFEETIREKNETLLSCLNEFLDLFIFYDRDSNELIFPVDNLCKWNREKISADIRHRLISSRSDIKSSIKIPVRWYVFDLNMKDEASKETHGMISLESCYSIGQRLGMDQEEVNECLIYLDSMRLCIYYHKLLPHVIFTNPQFLIDCLSNIARVSFIDDLMEIGIDLSHEDLKSLKTDGVFEKSLLDSLQLDFVPGLFSKEDLLSLMQHFLVISTIKTADKSPRYFVPVLLPAERLNEEQKALFARVADPLLFPFDKTVLQVIISKILLYMSSTFIYFFYIQGLFLTLVVSLLSREEEPKFFIDSRSSEFPQQLRHAVKLYTEELFGSVFLCENNESIEVYFTGHPRHCNRLHKVICEALSVSANVLQYDEQKIKPAFVRCTQKHILPAHDEMIHSTEISYKNYPPEISCSVETSLPTTDLSDRQSCWLIGKSI